MKKFTFCCKLHFAKQGVFAHFNINQSKIYKKLISCKKFFVTLYRLREKQASEPAFAHSSRLHMHTPGQRTCTLQSPQKRGKKLTDLLTTTHLKKQQL